MHIPLSRVAVLVLGACFLAGCSGDGDNFVELPTAPSTPSIRGVYSSSTFWSFEALRLEDGQTLAWSCTGRVTVIRQSGADFLGNFISNPPDGERCEPASGNLTSGIIRRDARISFDTTVLGQDPDEFFAFPGCVVVNPGGLWSGTANGDRFVARRRLTVDCPGDGRLEITATADGSRADSF